MGGPESRRAGRFLIYTHICTSVHCISALRVGLSPMGHVTPSPATWRSGKSHIETSDKCFRDFSVPRTASFLFEKPLRPVNASLSAPEWASFSLAALNLTVRHRRSQGTLVGSPTLTASQLEPLSTGRGSLGCSEGPKSKPSAWEPLPRRFPPPGVFDCPCSSYIFLEVQCPLTRQSVFIRFNSRHICARYRDRYANK